MADKFASTAWRIFGGLLIWATDFVVTYAFVAIACARGFAAATLVELPLVPLITTSIHVLAITGIALTLRRAVARGRNLGEGNAGLVQFLAVSLSTLALLAILWGSLPPLLQAQPPGCV